ncbi:MAG: hypothetical protein H0V29_06410 [Thermoleophilaceae bacterium]|nr:hypothetical protein [Thermoleophilaceae bacterium]
MRSRRAEQSSDCSGACVRAPIDHLKIAKGPITASGTLPGDKTELLAQLEADGRVEFPVEVSLTDGNGVEVARVTVQWHLRKS